MGHDVKITKNRYGSYFLETEGASCSVSLWPLRALHLGSLLTKPEYRKQGHASALLEVAKQIARHMDLELELTANPFDDKPLGLDELIKFYQSHGFMTEKMYGDYACAMRWKL